MEWLHYAPKQFALDRSRTYQSGRVDKPAGLWVSTGNEDGWRAWREGEDWGIPATEYVYRVTFAANAKLLVVEPRDIPRLHERFPRGRMDEIMPWYLHYEGYPSWETIAEQYDGLLMPSYAWEHRLEVQWYYSWDCSSGCVWNLDAIDSLECVATIVDTKPAEQVA